jgi:formylglycine-generating enzyme required for sulfatase activity
LPSYNEWYKAAYYNPINSTYYDYANGSNTAPTAVASGTAQSTAVYNQSSPADVNLAGGLSPYGVMGLAGNVWEWEESSNDLLNNSPTSTRGQRGSSYSNSDPTESRSLKRNNGGPTTQWPFLGFRVASLNSDAPPAVPGPLPLIGAAAGYGWSRQLRKRIQLASSHTFASKLS